MYASWNGSNWVFQTLDGNGMTGSLRLDSADNPHIAYLASDWPNYAYAVKYATLTGSGWSIQTLESTQDNVGYPYLALDSNNDPHIIYEKDVYSHSVQILSIVKYAVWANISNSWHFTTAFTNVTLGDMALDSSGYPHFTYLEGLSNGALAYASLNGTIWTTQSLVNLTAYSYSYLVLDSHNNPYVTYIGQTGGLMYARWNGTAWDILPVNQSNATTAASIAIDSYGNPHLCYPVRDGSWFLKYATETESTQTTPNPSPISAINIDYPLWVTLAVVIIAVIIALVYYRKKRP